MDMEGASEQTASEVATGGTEGSAQGSASRSNGNDTSKSRRCGYCNSKLSQDHSKPFCDECIFKLAGKETAQVVKECRALQSEMLATLQSFRTTLEKGRDEGPSGRDTPHSQEDLSTSYMEGSQGQVSFLSKVEEGQVPEFSTGVDQAQTSRERDTVLRTLETLGWMVSREKSSLTPSQSKLYLGYLIDSQAQRVCLPTEKVAKVQNAVIALLEEEEASLRTQEIILLSFCQNPKNNEEERFHLLDVRRCLLAYLERASSLLDALSSKAFPLRHLCGHSLASVIAINFRPADVHHCPLPKIRRKSPIHDCSVDPDAFQQRAKMFNEFLEDFGYPLDNPGTCRCQESTTHGFGPVAKFLHPIFKFLSGRYDSGLSRLHRNLECPFDLLHSWFLKLESVHWHRLAMVAPWLQDLLEMSHRKPKSHRKRSLSRKLQRCQPSLESLSELQTNVYQTAYMELPKKVPYEPGQEEELKNSLKVDLETHQLYLTHIESRLCCLERRAEDVTRHLEKANLELQAIKRGSATLQTLVDQQMSLAADDFEYLDVLDSLFEDVIWSGGSLQTQRACCNQILRLVGPCRPELSHPTAGSSREQQSDVEAGIYQCQDQINVLLQQISQQIDQTEMDLNIAIKHVEGDRI
ncbi:uncharacterized protein LOC143929771 [Lithobates pipiens]